MFDVTKVLIPYPKRISESKGEVLIGHISKPYFSWVVIGRGEILKEAEKLFWEKMGKVAAITKESLNPSYEIVLKINSSYEMFSGKEEAYAIEIKEKKAEIIAVDEAGAYYGITTFTALLHTVDDVIYLPKLSILDWPDFKVRGQFLECRFGSDFMTLDDWKKAIDYFASLKQNRMTIGVYGCWSMQYDHQRSEYLYIPFKNYPELKTPKNIKYYSVKNQNWDIRENVLPEMFEKDFFGEVIAYGKRKNIKIKPLFNSLGHNSLLPRLLPEMSAKNLDGSDKKYGFCTEREVTYEHMFNFYDEIIDRYLAPHGIDSIGIGLDEVWPSTGVYQDDIYKKVTPFCECEACRRKNESELVIDYIIRICKHLVKKGMESIYIYYDMLFYNFDTINEELKNRFIKEGIYKYVVIDWWSYGWWDKKDHVFKDRFSEVNNIFRSIIKPMSGYYHYSIPTDNNYNIRLLSKKAKQLGFEGIEPYGSYDECFDKNFRYGADLSWNMDTADDCDNFNKRYVSLTFPGKEEEALKALDSMAKIMTVEHSKNWCLLALEYYFSYSSLPSEPPYPCEFPEKAFRTILEDEDNLKQYLNVTREEAAKAAAFFASNNSHISEVWHLTAKHYEVLCDFYSTMLKVYYAYKNESISVQELLAKIEELFNKQERLMRLAESVRLEANSYVYLRNMSIFRQFLLDLKIYLNKEINSGRKPNFDICNFSYIKTDVYDFIR